MDPALLMQGAGLGFQAIGLLKKPKTGMDLAKLRRDAEKNGFNALTVLKATGGAAYSRQDDMSPFLSFGQGLSSFGSAMQDNRQLNLAERLGDAELALMKAQTSSAQRQPVSASRVASPAQAQPQLIPGSPDNEKQVGYETVTNPNPTGSGRFVWPYSPDAEGGEARYSEFGGAAYGISNVMTDYKYNRSLDLVSENTGIARAEIHRRVSEGDQEMINEVVRNFGYLFNTYKGKPAPTPPQSGVDDFNATADGTGWYGGLGSYVIR